MRFMVIVKATQKSEAGVFPTQQEIEKMVAFNEQMAQAGVLLAGDGLHPSSKGARIRFDGAKKTVTDGPFAETKELVAGFWMLQVKSKEEAVEWMKRAPMEADTEIELRQVISPEDFGEAVTPETREKIDRMHEQAAARDAK
jgi:hypothetical protein